MFGQIIRFFRRIFRSKGFRTAARIIFWMVAGFFLFNFFHTAFILKREIGMSFHQATVFILDTLLSPLSRAFVSVILGVIIGVTGYYRGRKKKAASEAEEKQAEQSGPEPAQEEEIREEEIIETKHYTFR